MMRDADSRERVLKRVMREIYHIPLPRPAVRWRRITAFSMILYGVLLAVMIPLRAEVVQLWQWLIASALVSTVDWAVTNRWSLVDMAVVLSAVLASLWVVRTRGHSRG